LPPLGFRSSSPRFWTTYNFPPGYEDGFGINSGAAQTRDADTKLFFDPPEWRFKMDQPCESLRSGLYTDGGS
jgi:hypothetical protein